MVILCDQEAAEIIKQMCDVSLRAGGMQNLGAINAVIARTQILKAPELEAVIGMLSQKPLPMLSGEDKKSTVEKGPKIVKLPAPMKPVPPENRTK
jgi:hypothetical protein